MQSIMSMNYQPTEHYTPATPTQQLTAAHGGEDTPMILVGTNNTILTINHAAATLFDVVPGMVKGKSVTILGDALEAVAQQPTRPGSSNLLQLGNGKMVLTNTRTVVGQNQQPMGRVVTLQPVHSPIEQFTPPMSSPVMSPAIGTLQDQIKNMQELIEMMPTFNNNRYWQNLLLEHMQRLIQEMQSQVQEIIPIAPSA